MGIHAALACTLKGDRYSNPHRSSKAAQSVLQKGRNCLDSSYDKKNLKNQAKQ